MHGPPRHTSPTAKGVFPSQVDSHLPFPAPGSNHGQMLNTEPERETRPASAPRPDSTPGHGPTSAPRPGPTPGHVSALRPGPTPEPNSRPAPTLAAEHAQLPTHPMVTRNQDHTRHPKGYPDFVTTSTRHPLPQGLVAKCSNDVDLDPTSFSKANKGVVRFARSEKETGKGCDRGRSEHSVGRRQTEEEIERNRASFGLFSVGNHRRSFSSPEDSPGNPASPTWIEVPEEERLFVLLVRPPLLENRAVLGVGSRHRCSLACRRRRWIAVAAVPSSVAE
ncbi:hypothetical protein MRB53_020579 [Persea americana]|uniref:Uncharacterized protein n=1 Tax=Persea americana TaxID=3435 RepID=A0ACC2L2H5_PERAE|nr:hypothetical protein MRB53_020579 [Persea americana]